jgi:hypothetical protein
MQPDDVKHQPVATTAIKIALAESFMYPGPYFSAYDNKICYVRMTAKTVHHYMLPREHAAQTLTEFKKSALSSPYTHALDIVEKFKNLHTKNKRLSLSCLLQLITDEQKLQIQELRFKEFLSECSDLQLAKSKELLKHYQLELEDYRKTSQGKTSHENDDTFKAIQAHCDECQNKCIALTNRRQFIRSWISQDDTALNEAAKRELYPSKEKFTPLNAYIAKLLRFALEENKALENPSVILIPR